MGEERPPDVSITVTSDTARELHSVISLPRIVRADMSSKARDELLAVLDTALAPPPPPPEEDPPTGYSRSRRRG